MNDPKWITVLAMLVIGSFAIDRIVSAVLFPFFRDPPKVPKSTPEENQKELDRKYNLETKYKLYYFILAAALAIIVLASWGKIRVLAGLGYPPDPNPFLDAILTGIVLVGGADRLADLKPAGAAPAPEPEQKPLQVTGQLYLIDNTSGAPRK
jgi:hypothetical protein